MRLVSVVGLRLCVLIGAVVANPAAAASLNVVAAENFYADVARQVGGELVTVSAVLRNPDQDPHLFEASPAIARALSRAVLVIDNGAGYDPWMDKLLAASPGVPGRAVIRVADLIGKTVGDNPHLWYDPYTMSEVARAVAKTLAARLPDQAAAIESRRAAFDAALSPVRATLDRLHGRLAGQPATATEPVFGYMFDRLGMTVRNQSFQRAVMNDTEPAATDIAAFEQDLRGHAVVVLVYNSQASSPVARRMERIAHANHIPVLGVTETEPAGQTYQAWMGTVLAALDKAVPP